MAAGPDDPIAEHFAGTLPAAGQEDLAARLAADPDLRRRFAVALRRDLLLDECLRADAARPAPRRMPWAGWGLAAAVLLAVAGWWWWPAAAGPEPVAAARPLLDGVAMSAGAPAETGDRPADLHWPGDGGRIRVAPRSRLVWRPGTGHRLDLLAGTLSATMAPRPAADPLVVATPTAEATVLGTVFTLGFDPGTGTSTLAVERGLVRFASASGSVLVRAGDRARGDRLGLWLDHGVTPATPGPVTDPPLAVVLDRPAPAGTASLLLAPEPGTAVRIRLRSGTAAPQEVQLGRRWPAGWHVQTWQPEAVGEAAIGPHPGDGAWCATLRNLSGPPGVQCMGMPVEVPSGSAAVVAWRYRTEGSAQPRIYLILDGRRSRIAHLPAAQGGWRHGRIDLAPAPATRAVRVVITNYGRDPGDILALRDLGIWAGDR